MSTLALKDSTRRFISTHFVRRLIVAGGALLAGVALVAPFFVWRYDSAGRTVTALRLLNTHDLSSIVAIMEQFDKVLRSGVLYPRWLPDINYGYGVATMVYYPPGLFYLSSMIHAVVRDWVTTVFVIAAVSAAVSGLAFYALSRLFYGRVASAIGALFYIALPYHALDLYWRGALPEFVGFAFLPVIVYFAYKLGSQRRLRYYAGLGFFFGVFLMTHLPVGYLLCYALGLYAMVWAIRDKNLRIALRIAGGMSIGLVLSAAYWLPAALESKYTLDLVTGLFPYHKSYITLQDVDSTFDNLVNLVFSFQALALIVALLVLRFTRGLYPNSSLAIERETGRLWWGRPSNDDPASARPVESQTRLWSIMAVVATFMCTSLSIYVSKLIPKIQVAVPAWRWLAISSLFVCLLLAAAVDRLISAVEIERLKLWVLRTAIATVIVMNVGLTAGSVIPSGFAKGTYVRSDNVVLAGFTPKESSEPDYLPRTPDVVVQPAGGVVETTRWDPQHRQIAVRVGQPSELRLKTYYFPGWSARIDGQKTELSRDGDGVQLLAIPEGRHLVEVDFVDTAPRFTGKMLFGLGLVVIIGLAATDYKRRKRLEEALDSAGELAKPSTAIHFRRPPAKVLMSAAVALLIIVLAFAVVLWSAPRSGTIPAKGASGTTDSSGEVRLSVAGWDLIPVAVDEKDLAELLNAIAARNDDRVEELVRSGRVFRARANSKVRVLQTSYGKLNVRFLEGESITLEGWVPERWVK